MLSPSRDKAKNGQEEKDSPAFRLRPRRSTPKPSPSPLNGQRYAMLRSLPAAVNLTPNAAAVKRKLFKLHEEEDTKPPAKSPQPPCPAQSIAANVSISAFVEKITVDSLSHNGEYASNYVSLRVLKVTNDVVMNGTENSVLVLLTQEAISDKETLNKKKPVVPVYLFDDYASCPNIQVGVS